MINITQPMLEQAVLAQGTQGVEFDSHDIIRFLYTNCQHAYLDELLLHQTAKYPFTETHRQIGRALLQLTTLIRKRGKVVSAKTPRGVPTRVEKWRRI